MKYPRYSPIVYVIAGGMIRILQSATTISHAIRLTITPNDGNQDVANTVSQQIEWKSHLITQYIQLANHYLWFAMIIIVFIAIIWLWFKLLTAPVDNEAESAIKKTIINGWLWILIAMMAYVIVRVVINFL